MRIDTFTRCNSSFLSCEKDIEKILKKLFVDSHKYSEDLLRLLVINTKDCLDNRTSEVYSNKIKEMTLPKLIKEGYVKIVPKMLIPEHEEIKSYIIISFDNFTPSGNPQFRDCIVHFDIICHTDYWDIGDYRLRPFKIMGIIDGLLDNSRLSGIGTFQFMGADELILNEELSGYSIRFSAVHGTDDWLPPVENADS